MVSTLGDSLLIVSGVYVAVLIPWTLLYTLDFISSKWICIKNTERKGVAHLIIITIPISYIVAYIVFQTKLLEPDYKEMYAAVAALVLSGYHLARTVWGLRQLVYLKRWVRYTAQSFRDAGYDFEQEPGTQKMKKSSTEGDQCLACGLCSLFTKVPFLHRIFSQKYETGRDAHEVSVNDVVQGILVSNSLIDNEFNAGIADHVKLVSWRRMLCLPLKPSKPMVTFTRWATAFIAQFGTSWLSDAIVAEENGDPWIDKRRNFALQVLTTAVLQMDPLHSHGYIYSKKPSEPIGKNEEAFLPPRAWEEISDWNGTQHVFSLPKVLDAFLRQRKGLPYGFHAVSEGGEAAPRSLLKPIIKEAINGLKPRMQEALEDFGPEHLELFAMFLWVQNARDSKRSQKPSFRREENVIASEASYEFLQRQLGLDEDDRALRSLVYPFSKHARSRHLWYNRNVLEVSCRIDNWLALSSGEQLYALGDDVALNEGECDRDTVKVKELSGSESTPSRTSAERRNVSHQIPAEKLVNDSDSPVISVQFPGVSVKKHGKKETCYKQSKLLETKRLRFQLTNDETRCNHSEQSLTFMGCIMESLRSGLAEQLFAGQISEDRDKRKRLGSWVVPVPVDFLEFPISHELWKCLRKHKTKTPLPTAVQERLLWECQVGTHHSFQGVLGEANAHHRVASMILFILGFPSVLIRRKHVDRDRSRISSLEYTINAATPPQRIHVCVAIEKRKSIPIAKLHLLKEHPLENNEGFQWNRWRDSFLGRIKAKAKWQKSHGMSQVHVNARSDSDLSKPVTSIPQGYKGDRQQMRKNRNESKLEYWEGWPPFREGLAIFEQKLSLNHRKNAQPLQNSPAISGDEKSRLRQKEDVRNGTYLYATSSPTILSNNITDIDTALELRGRSVPWNKLKNTQENVKELWNSEGRRPPNSKKSPGWPIDGLRAFFLPGLSKWTNSSPTRPKVDDTRPSQDEIAYEAQKLDPKAMFEVAQWVLKGERGYQQDRERALIIMENAFQIDKDVDIAFGYMKACLEEANLNEAKRDENLDRVFSVVNLLWSDVETRLRERAEEETEERQKRERERVDQIIMMNGTMVREKRTSRTLQDFADRLTMWFHVRKDDRLRNRAIILYESAVIAEGDAFAMLKLALLNATSDEDDAMNMARRLCKTARQKLKAKDLSSPDEIRGNRYDFTDVSVTSYTLRDVSKYINFEKTRGHPGAERLARQRNNGDESNDNDDAAKSLDDISAVENAYMEAIDVIETSQDHTIVNMQGIERSFEHETLPPFPHSSYL